MLGAQDNKKIIQGYQYWRLITPTFLHGNLEHIAGNVVLQLILGVGIENSLGFGYMTVLYFSSAIGGNLLSGIMSPKAIGVGASTADFGLVGFYISYFITNFGYMGRKRPG